MEWITDNLVSILIFLGLVLLATEVLVLGFSIFIIFFFGVGCLLTGVLIFLGMIPATLVNALLGVAVITVLTALLSWKTLKKLQNDGGKKEVAGDFIGHSFILDSDISNHLHGVHKYSGIEWQVCSEHGIPAGVEVEVVKAEVGVLTVKAKD